MNDMKCSAGLIFVIFQCSHSPQTPQEMIPAKNSPQKFASIVQIAKRACAPKIDRLFKRYRFNNEKAHFHLHFVLFARYRTYIFAAIVIATAFHNLLVSIPEESHHMFINVVLTFQVCGCIVTTCSML